MQANHTKYVQTNQLDLFLQFIIYTEPLQRRKVNRKINISCTNQCSQDNTKSICPEILFFFFFLFFSVIFICHVYCVTAMMSDDATGASPSTIGATVIRGVGTCPAAELLMSCFVVAMAMTGVANTG